MRYRGLKLILILCAGLLWSCTAIEQQEEEGECLKWRSMLVEKKERLPYPLRGVVVREETVVYCVERKEKT